MSPSASRKKTRPVSASRRGRSLNTGLARSLLSAMVPSAACTACYGTYRRACKPFGDCRWPVPRDTGTPRRERSSRSRLITWCFDRMEARMTAAILLVCPPRVTGRGMREKISKRIPQRLRSEGDPTSMARGGGWVAGRSSAAAHFRLDHPQYRWCTLRGRTAGAPRFRSLQFAVRKQRRA